MASGTGDTVAVDLGTLVAAGSTSSVRREFNWTGDGVVLIDCTAGASSFSWLEFSDDGSTWYRQQHIADDGSVVNVSKDNQAEQFGMIPVKSPWRYIRGTVDGTPTSVTFTLVQRKGRG